MARHSSEHALSSRRRVMRLPSRASPEATAVIASSSVSIVAIAEALGGAASVVASSSGPSPSGRV
jgi:hypothetical protein